MFKKDQLSFLVIVVQIENALSFK